MFSRKLDSGRQIQKNMTVSRYPLKFKKKNIEGKHIPVIVYIKKNITMIRLSHFHIEPSRYTELITINFKTTTHTKAGKGER